MSEDKQVPELRKCKKCDERKPITQFAKRYRTQGPWLQSYCKTCCLVLKKKSREDRKKRHPPATLRVGTKFCNGHQTEEPKAEFGINRSNADFLDSSCKKWRREKYRQDRQPQVENNVETEEDQDEVNNKT